MAESLASLGTYEEYPTALAARIVSRFNLPRPMEAHEFREKGNINQQTFLIQAGRDAPLQDFLLQKINRQVFTRPLQVMQSMIACLGAQRKSLEQRPRPGGRDWEPITLMPTHAGGLYFDASNGRGEDVWRVMRKISDCHTYKSLDALKSRTEQLATAEEAGRGLAIFGDLTAELDVLGLANPLPGYRDTAVYFSQLHSVLSGNRSVESAEPFLPTDPVLRHSTEQHFIIHLTSEEFSRRVNQPEVRVAVDLLKENENHAMTLIREMEAGRIRTVAIHGDTKLDNFLFDDTTRQVRALIDLDTIMPHSWLADWGDMVRSLCNVAGEKARNIDSVQVDVEVYEALCRGFLTTAQRITPAEVELMTDAVEIISLELGLRFLTDYLRGNSYFRLTPTDSPDLNKIRGLVQLRLFEELRQKQDVTRECVHKFLQK